MQTGKTMRPDWNRAAQIFACSCADRCRTQNISGAIMPDKDSRAAVRLGQICDVSELLI